MTKTVRNQTKSFLELPNVDGFTKLIVIYKVQSTNRINHLSEWECRARQSALIYNQAGVVAHLYGLGYHRSSGWFGPNSLEKKISQVVYQPAQPSAPSLLLHLLHAAHYQRQSRRQSSSRVGNTEVASAAQIKPHCLDKSGYSPIAPNFRPPGLWLINSCETERRSRK